MKIEHIKQTNTQNIQKKSHVQQKPAVQRDVTSFGGNVASKEASQVMSNNFRVSQKMKQDKEIAFKGHWTHIDYMGHRADQGEKYIDTTYQLRQVYIDNNNNVIHDIEEAKKVEAVELVEEKAAKQRSWDSFVNNVKDEALNNKFDTVDSKHVVFGDGKTVNTDDSFLVALGHKVDKVKSMSAEQKKKFLAMEAEKLGDDFLKVINENIDKTKHLL